MMKRALITGITGQDGPYLAKLLLDKGYRVYGTYRRVSTPNFWRLQQLNLIKRVTLIPADLTDMASLLEAVTISDPKEIYNLAAQSFVGNSFDQPLLTTDVDASGSTRFLEIIRHLKKDIRYYQASTSELFGGSTENPQNELTPMIPNSPYAAAKLHSYHMVRIYRNSYNMFACNGILFNHECISENTPSLIRNKKTNAISIRRIKDIRRAREKQANVQQWQIKNLEIWDGYNFVDLKVLTATRRKKEDENFLCKTINTRHGIVEVTNHHNMIDSSSEKIKAQIVDVGEKLQHSEFPDFEGECQITYEEAVFLGMMTGDGYVSDEGKGQFSSNDIELLKQCEYLWKKVALGSTNQKEYTTEFGHVTQMRLNGNRKYLRYIKNELYTYDGFKKVPDRILNASKECQLAFLKGYNETDGLKSNRCTYTFKNFKTDSIILAQGLLFLMSRISSQDFNITFETDEKNYGYYSINFLSPINKVETEIEITELLEDGESQREISRQTGASRTFIRKIQQGGHAQTIHHLAKEKTEVKKTLYHQQQPEWVYDIETASGKFMAGVGNIIIANSPLRGLEFVTRKITNAVAKIKVGLQKDLHLGNTSAFRDWGFAPDYVRAMYMMMQHERSDDYVVATGETHSVAEFAQEAFNVAGLNWKNHVLTDQRLLRPLDVHQLHGSPKKAEEILGWKPRVTFKQLVKIMVDEDIKRWEQYLAGKAFPWDAPNHSHEIDIVSRNVVRDSQKESAQKRNKNKSFVQKIAQVINGKA